MEKDKVSRKQFFKNVATFGIAAIGASTLLKACGGGDDDTSGATVDPCNEGLSEQDLMLRQNLEYKAETEIPDQRCDNCALWIDKEPGEPCGGCQILPGQPIHAAGWCNSWVPMS